MPTWLKCNKCGEKFYTAKSYHFIKNKICDKCGNKLKIILDFYKKKKNESTI